MKGYRFPLILLGEAYLSSRSYERRIVVEPKPLRVIVSTNSVQMTFSIQIHQADAEHELFMDPIEFYKKYSTTDSVPEFPHHEMELVEVKIGTRESAIAVDLSEFLQSGKYHWRKAERVPRKVFACLTVPVASLEDAKDYLKIFAVGTVYTLFSGRDFVGGIKDAGGNQNFLTQMASLHGAVVSFEE